MSSGGLVGGICPMDNKNNNEENAESLPISPTNSTNNEPLTSETTTPSSSIDFVKDYNDDVDIIDDCNGDKILHKLEDQAALSSSSQQQLLLLQQIADRLDVIASNMSQLDAIAADVRRLEARKTAKDEEKKKQCEEKKKQFEKKKKEDELIFGIFTVFMVITVSAVIVTIGIQWLTQKTADVEKIDLNNENVQKEPLPSSTSTTTQSPPPISVATSTPESPTMSLPPSIQPLLVRHQQSLENLETLMARILLVLNNTNTNRNVNEGAGTPREEEDFKKKQHNMGQDISPQSNLLLQKIVDRLEAIATDVRRLEARETEREMRQKGEELKTRDAEREARQKADEERKEENGKVNAYLDHVFLVLLISIPLIVVGVLALVIYFDKKCAKRNQHH